MRHIVSIEEPHPHSMAARVLLTRKLKEQERMLQVAFRSCFLEKEQSRIGTLRCHYCGREDLVSDVPMNASKAEMRNLATIDHVVPISKGGPERDEGNVVVACYPCNQRKGDSDLSEMSIMGK